MNKVRKFSHRKTGGVISVAEFGARGDGVTDDTQALQWALNEEQSVYIPTGIYLVDGSLTASIDKQSIKGAGKGTVLKLKGSKTYDLSKEHAALRLNADHKTVDGLQLTGRDTGDDSTFTGSGSDWYNLSAQHVHGDWVTVSGIHVDRCEGVGMAVSGIHCDVSLCSIQWTGLDGLRATASFTRPMLLNEGETGRAFPDAAEDEKPMRLFGKQLVLAFGDFSMLHKWRGRARAKGKGKLRQNARRFKVVVAKECMSTMRTRKGAPRERGLVMIR
jgi:hypothetical protein